MRRPLASIYRDYVPCVGLSTPSLIRRPRRRGRGASLARYERARRGCGALLRQLSSKAAMCRLQAQLARNEHERAAPAASLARVARARTLSEHAESAARARLSSARRLSHLLSQQGGALAMKGSSDVEISLLTSISHFLIETAFLVHRPRC